MEAQFGRRTVLDGDRTGACLPGGRAEKIGEGGGVFHGGAGSRRVEGWKGGGAPPKGWSNFDEPKLVAAAVRADPAGWHCGLGDTRLDEVMLLSRLNLGSGFKQHACLGDFGLSLPVA